jgi:putative photosynthetic complex assembly protein
MSDPFENHAIPRPALFGLVGLVLFALAAVVIAQALGYKAGQPPPDSIVEQRDLRFTDGSAGIVHVWDAARDVKLRSIEPGTENFVRGVLRGFARDRRSHALGTQTPFRLARHADGRLTIEDLATGRRIDLQAFGQTNVGAFKRLLTMSTQAL